MNDEGECDRNSDEHKGPWTTELGGHGSCCREEHEDLEDTAPLGCPLLEVAEHDIADREDRCDQGDFKPRIHVRRRGECRGLTQKSESGCSAWPNKLAGAHRRARATVTTLRMRYLVADARKPVSNGTLGGAIAMEHAAWLVDRSSPAAARSLILVTPDTPTATGHLPLSVHHNVRDRVA
jgi:hypothetical protein